MQHLPFNWKIQSPVGKPVQSGLLIRAVKHTLMSFGS